MGMEQRDYKPADLVLYHGHCYDGFTAAWAARKHSPDAEFVGVQNGDGPPDVKGRRVLILDFAYRRGDLEDMEFDAESLFVIDHHKTNRDKLHDLPFAFFDMERSGAGLAWDLLVGGQRPEMVDYVEDRDLWKFEMVDTKKYHAAMTSIAMTFDNWDEIAAMPVLDMIDIGESIYRFGQLTAQKFAVRAREIMFAGTKFWVVNCPVEFVGETADVLLERPEHYPVLSWMWDGERGNYYCSLRSQADGIDVSSIATKCGGGGHLHAAGFRSERPPV